MKTTIEQEAHNIVERHAKNGCLDLSEAQKDIDVITGQPLTNEEY